MNVAASTAPAVSVIVPVHNGRTSVERLLVALAEQTFAKPYEIIVVDDGSTDSISDLMVNWPEVRYVRLEESRGSYAARNRGLEIARGSIVAFTDADCTPTPAWLERGVEVLESGADLVAGCVQIDLPERPSAAALVDSMRFLDQKEYASLGFGATANLLVRRSVFDRVGGFNMRLLSGGDREFGVRATDAGATIEYAPQAVVLHASRTSLRAIARKSVRIGLGLASQRRHAYPPIRSLIPRPWRIYVWVPSRRLTGRHRLPDELPRRREALLHVVDYFAVQLPMALGILIGSVRHGG